MIELDENDDLLPHYDFDYLKAKPNRFAEAYKKGVTTPRIQERNESNESEQTDFEGEHEK